MGGSRHRSGDIATVVSRVLHAASICAPIVLLGARATLTQGSESSALAADIPAQPLAQALAAFRRQTGLQLIYVSSVIGSQRSQAIAAGLQADEALVRLLQGTGLRFEHLTPRSIRIFAGVVAPPETTPRVLTAREQDEVIVTANRGAEKLQDVPVTIQAITGDQLNQLNVTTTNDLLKNTTNVTFSGDGPGTGNIFIRGLGGSGSGNQSQSTTGPFPNVALYLDDQSMQFPARNSDVYLVDVERVEVLEGPQGTLFGGGAQAGAIRYITNKPRLEAASGEVNAGYGVTAGGDPNTSLNAVLNVPLVDNKFGLRAAIFSDRRGGYIDNIPATIGYIPGTIPHDLGGNPSANNGPLQGSNTNSVDVQGLRVSALWIINDSWDALLQQNYQDMHSEGYFYAYPTSTDGQALQHYQLTAFAPAFSKDRYESTALTINGKIGNILDEVYRGSYMVRHIEGQQDYSNYLRSAVGSSYYACIGTGAGYFNQNNFPSLTGHPLQCSTAVGSWNDKTSNQHQSHEIRLSTHADNRLRGLVGAYWEKFVIDDNMNFNYLGIPQCNQANLDIALAGGADCLSAVGPTPGSFATTPGLRTDSNTAFGENVQRGYKQTAAFTSIDFDIIPKVLTATGGVRWYKYDEFEHGSEYFSESASAGLVVNHLNGVCTAAGLCGFPINLGKSETGHRWRTNLTWHVTNDIMAYYTYSEGFRPGGLNRTSSPLGVTPNRAGIASYCGNIGGVQNAADPRCLPGGSLFGLNTSQFNAPVGYESDSLTNNEIGFKTEWFDHRLILNLSGYVMKWGNVQLPLFDPVHLGNTTFDINGLSYKVKGFEIQFVARLFEGFTLEGSSSVNSAEQTNAPCLPSNRPTAANPTPLGQCITVVDENTYTNPYGVRGTRPPFSPPWMFNLLARYDWAAGAYKPFAWVGASHIASMSNEPASFPDGNAPSESPPTGWPTTTLLRYQIPGYTTYDSGLGVAKDNWTAQIQCHNLSNAYGPTNISSGQFIKADIPLRPRVITFLIGYRF
jgi:iron complex outermembrane recepter protein